MARFSWLRSLTRRDKQGAPRQPARRRRAAPLALEQLEARDVPTVVFQPAFGPEVVKWDNPNNAGQPPGQVVTQPITNNPTVLNNPAVYFIFWGQSWKDSDAKRFVADAQTIYNSLYLSALTDYGSDGLAHYGGGYYIDNSADPVGDPVAATTEIQNVLPKTSFDKPQSQSPVDSPIYVVVFDSGGAIGNGPDKYTPLGSNTALEMNHIWMGLTGPSDERAFTDLLGHETAERISSGSGGIVVDTPAGSPTYDAFGGNNSQIGDNEPDMERYTYQLSGANGLVSVQAYWSLSAQAFVVPDGNSETVSLHPKWAIDTSNNTATFSNTFDLTINGDAGADNVIALDSTKAGTQLTFNGQSFRFRANELANVTINPGSGRNTVTVADLVKDLPVTIDSSGSDTVNLGTNQSLAGVLGNVSVYNSNVQGNNQRVTLNLDDSKDATDRIITLDEPTLGFYTVTGNGLGTVQYAFNTLAALNIDGGPAANTFDFRVTAPYFTTTLDTGYGSDNIRVRATSGPLVLTSTATNPAAGPTNNAVLLGSRAPALGGSLLGFFGPVSVSNATGSTRLTVDDSADPNALNYTLTSNSLTNDYYLGAPAAINFGRGVSSLEVRGGSGANTVHVLATGPATTIDAGSGTSAVTVGDAGHNLLLVDALTVNGNGKTALTVDDRGNGPAPTGFLGFVPLQTQYLVQPNSLTRTALASVILPDVGPTVLGFTSVIKYRGLGGVAIDSGPLGPYTYQIDSTGGSGGVTVNAGSPLDAVTAGDAQDNLTGVRSLAVNGNGHTLLTVDDTGNVPGLVGASVYVPTLTQFTAQSFALTCDATATLIPPSGVPTGQVFRSKVSYQGLSALTIDGGGFAPNLYQIDSTVGADSVTVNAGGQDAVTVGDARHNLKDVGSLKVNGNGGTSLVVDDTGNRPVTTVSSVYVPLLTQFFVQAGSSPPPSGILTRLATALANPAPGLPPTTQVFPSTITYQGLSGLTVDGGHTVTGIYEIDSTNGTQALTLNGGNVFNVFSVEGTTAGTTTTVNGGSGGSTVNLSPTAHNLADLAGLVQINGQGGTNTLNVFDQATTFAPGPGAGDTLYQDHFMRGIVQGGPTVFTYGGVQSVNFSTGRGDSGFEIFGIASTPAGVPVTVTDASPTSQVEFFAGSPLDLLQGPLTVVGRAGALDLLLLDDANTPSSQTYTVTATTVNRPGMAQVTYANLTQINLYTNDTGVTAAVDVQSTAPTTFTQVLLLTAGDQAAVNAPGVQGSLRILSNGAAAVPVSVTVDDSGDSTPRTATFSTDPTYRYLLNGLAPGRVYLDLDPGSSAQVFGGSGGNTFNVQSTPAGVSLAINAGAGNDTVNLGSAANSLDPITGLAVQGNGHTTLVLNDQGAAVRENYLVYTGKFARGPVTSPATDQTQIVTYSGLAGITVNGADVSGNVFFALGTAAGTSLSLNAGSGGFNAFVATDEYNPADTSPGTDQLLGPVAFHGHQTSDFGERYDYYDGAGHTFTFTAAGAVSTVQRDGAADLTYDGLSEMIVYVPKGGGNQLNVQSVAPGVYMNLTLSAGDQAVVGSLAPALGGTTANILYTVQFGDEVPGVTSAVTVDDSGDTSTAARRVTIAPPPPNPDNSGSSAIGLLGNPVYGVYWRLNPGSSVALRGGAGNTTFALQGALPDVTLSIAGGAGVNTLDYSGWTGDVSVNLQLGTATGVDGGISNIRNVTGSIGNDLLVGDANANVLIGGTGRNVIIGGGGADQITGGGGDNLLIGGTTDYDQNAAALDLIMEEWLQASDFATRMNALQTGGDLLSGTGIHLDSTTVHTDGLATVMPGPGNNWVIP